MTPLGTALRVAGIAGGLMGLFRRRRQERRGRGEQDYSPVPDHPFLGTVTPNVAPANYQHGIMGEFNYGFNNGGLVRSYAQGGLVRGYAEGGLASLPAAPAQPQPQGQPTQKATQDQGLVRMAVAAIQGQVPNPEQILKLFVARFGQKALMDLVQRIKGGGASNGQNDQIPAQLSEGEFVVPSDVVSGMGNGSTEAGASQLQEMMARVRQARGGSPQQPPQINPQQVMPQ